MRSSRRSVVSDRVIGDTKTEMRQRRLMRSQGKGEMRVSPCPSLIRKEGEWSGCRLSTIVEVLRLGVLVREDLSTFIGMKRKAHLPISDVAPAFSSAHSPRTRLWLSPLLRWRRRPFASCLISICMTAEIMITHRRRSISSCTKISFALFLTCSSNGGLRLANLGSLSSTFVENPLPSILHISTGPWARELEGRLTILALEYVSGS